MPKAKWNVFLEKKRYIYVKKTLQSESTIKCKVIDPYLFAAINSTAF